MPLKLHQVQSVRFRLHKFGNQRDGLVQEFINQSNQIKGKGITTFQIETQRKSDLKLTFIPRKVGEGKVKVPHHKP